MKVLVHFLLRILYRFRACGTASLQTKGPVLLLSNHVSWWDWLLLGVCLEDDWRFVTSSTTARLSWVHRAIMINRRTFPVDLNSPYAMKHIAEYLQRGGRLVLFPEGRLSTTGSLMKLFDGTGFLIFKTRATVITAYLRGAARLPFSPNSNRKKWFPRLSVHFSAPQIAPHPEHPTASGVRTSLTDWLQDKMVRHQFDVEMECGPATLPSAIAAAGRQAPNLAVLQDFTLRKLTYRKLWIAADLLARQWRKAFGDAPDRVGILLPNVNALPVTLLSLWGANKIPAVLNYTAGPAAILACIRLADLKRVITSKSFVAGAKLDLEALRKDGVDFLFLEDTRSKLSLLQKLSSFLRHFPRPPMPKGNRPLPEDTAVILFTSGSEGTPKGVELTHANLLVNIRQMLSVIDLQDTDRLFNALPLFHSFGLTIGLLLPLVRSGFVFLYLSPLHYRVVPSAFYNLDCTVFFSTNTFLTAYARKAHPYDFRSLRYVFAGAEKVYENTSTLWMRKFGARVLEGYGATECSPCLSVNVPLNARAESAGRFLPGIEYRLDPVEGIGVKGSAARGRKAGRLYVRGPNIMRGYVNPEADASFQALGGWYDTGDIAEVDGDGFVYLLGRLKRFAKISGEMVSLVAVEEALAEAFPEYGQRFGVAVLARPSQDRGEKLVVVTNEPRLTMDGVRQAIKARGLGNLALPREIKVMPELPRLGTGKVNLPELEKLLAG